MTIINTNAGYILEITHLERNVFVNAINFIITDLEEELSTRTGFTINKYQSLLKLLGKNNLENEIFNKVQLIMIHQALNEVCNGIYLPDFETVIGMPVSKVRILFDLIDIKINH